MQDVIFIIFEDVQKEGKDFILLLLYTPITIDKGASE